MFPYLQCKDLPILIQLPCCGDVHVVDLQLENVLHNLSSNPIGQRQSSLFPDSSERKVKCPLKFDNTNNHSIMIK